MDEHTMGTGPLARASGLTVSALRLHDAAGVVVPAEVDPRSGYRRYTPQQADDARLVAELRRTAMPLEVIRSVLAGDGLNVAVSTELLLQALAAAGDGQLDLALDGPITPLVLRSADRRRSTLPMPVAL